jgi:hypothetical protein
MLLAASAIRDDSLQPSTIIGANLDLEPPGMIPSPLFQRDSYDCRL